MKYNDDILSDTGILHNNLPSWKALILIILSLFEVAKITPVESEAIRKLSKGFSPLFTWKCFCGIFELVFHIEIFPLWPDIIFWIDFE